MKRFLLFFFFLPVVAYSQNQIDELLPWMATSRKELKRTLREFGWRLERIDKSTEGHREQYRKRNSPDKLVFEYSRNTPNRVISYQTSDSLRYATWQAELRRTGYVLNHAQDNRRLWVLDTYATKAAKIALGYRREPDVYVLQLSAGDERYSRR